MKADGRTVRIGFDGIHRIDEVVIDAGADDQRIENDVLVELRVVAQLLADRKKLDQRPHPAGVKFA
jgi:hypothetical protein